MSYWFTATVLPRLLSPLPGTVGRDVKTEPHTLLVGVSPGTLPLVSSLGSPGQVEALLAPRVQGDTGQVLWAASLFPLLRGMESPPELAYLKKYYIVVKMNQLDMLV